MFSRSARWVILAVTMTLSWSVWAACADAGALMQGAQMTCCKDGHMTCGPHGSPSDCCKTEAARPHDAVAHAKIEPVHTLVAVVTWAISPTLSMHHSASGRPFQSSSPPLHAELAPPPYIAFSTLLI